MLLGSALLPNQPMAQTPPKNVSPVLAGLNEDNKNWMQGFPRSADNIISVKLGNHYQWPQLRWTFCNIQQLVPTKSIWRGNGAPATLPLKSKNLESLNIVTNTGTTLNWQQACVSTDTDAIAVMHKGKLVHEQYFNHCNESSGHLIMSCAKSFAGLLAEIFISKEILNENALVPDYLPELKNSAWQYASVRQVMDMLVGMEFHEDYLNPRSDVWKYLRAGGMVPGDIPTTDPQNLFEYLLTVNKQAVHGEKFAYREPNINVLTYILQRITQKDLKDLVSEYIWQEIGAEHDATYMVDPSGSCTTAACTLRDFLRFGEFMRTSVDKNILTRLTSGGSQQHFSKAKLPAMQGWSYKSQWWVRHKPSGNAIQARGAHGQFLYVDPAHDLVIARFGSAKLPPNYLNDSVLIPMFDAIAKQVSAKQL